MGRHKKTYTDYSPKLKLNDEELALLDPNEFPAARNELCTRYIASKKYFLAAANPALSAALDEWTLYDAFLSALAIALNRYSKKMDCLFKTFFISVLRNELLKEVKNYFVYSEIVSLDETKVDQQGEEYCLSDIIPASRSTFTTPIFYVESREIAEILRSMTRYHARIARAILEFIEIGYSLSQACDLIPISYARGRYIMTRFMEAMEDWNRLKRDLKTKKKIQR